MRSSHATPKPLLWDGTLILGHSCYLYHGTINRPTRMNLPFVQYVAFHDVDPLLMDETAKGPFLIVPPGAPSGPTFAPITVTVLVIDSATTIARNLVKISQEDFHKNFQLEHFWAGARTSLERESLQPMFETFAHHFNWTDPIDSFGKRTSRDRRIAAFLDVLNANIHVNSVQEAAAYANLSVRRFCDVFKNDVGINCSEYLAMQKAIPLYRQVGLEKRSLSRASAHIGLIDYSHLVKSINRFIEADPRDFYGVTVKGAIDPFQSG
jgi:AraC-like DNA-binding protein